MSGVGAPGGKRPRGAYRRGHKNPAAGMAYRHSEKGMMARRLRNQNPEVRARNKVRRDLRKRLHGGG